MSGHENPQVSLLLSRSILACDDLPTDSSRLATPSIALRPNVEWPVIFVSFHERVTYLFRFAPLLRLRFSLLSITVSPRLGTLSLSPCPSRSPSSFSLFTSRSPLCGAPQVVLHTYIIIIAYTQFGTCSPQLCGTRTCWSV